MATVYVLVNGDRWINPEQVYQELTQIPSGEPVLWHIQEGLSLITSGIASAIETWQAQTGRKDSDIEISCVNHQDQLPWKNIHPDRNACWVMSKKFYHQDCRFITQSDRLFGFFIGRRSLERNVMFWQVAHWWPEYFLLSRTINTAPDYWHGDLATWIDSECHEDLKVWTATCGIGSIDGLNQKDQFDASKNPNARLLEFYDRFQIELVAETMTLGGAFFPTEKITRPMVGLKPWVVYAAQGYLANLRRLGFKTFGDFWDESYDELEGPDRWRAMTLVIESIIHDPDRLAQTRDHCHHNRQRLLEIQDPSTI